MNLNSNSIQIRIQRVAPTTLSPNWSTLLQDSLYSPDCYGSISDKKEEIDYIIGETVYFSVLIENSGDSSITVTSISAMDISEHSQKTLTEIVNSTSETNSIFKPFQLHHHSIRTFRYSRMLCEIGKHTIKITIHYTDAVKSSILTRELSFTTVKPFTLAFTRYPMSDTSYLIHSIITNNMKQPLTITKVEIYNLLPSLQETYNSFSEPESIQSGKKYCHSCIVDGTLQPKSPFGSICIHFKISGHEEIQLNSTSLLIDNISLPSIRGYYEFDGELKKLQTTEIAAIITNYSNNMLFLQIDWSRLSSTIQVVGQSCFSQFIQPQKTIRFPLTIIPLLSGNQVLEAPQIQINKSSQSQDIKFSPISVFVQ